ncbi:MAG: hypothetical protein JNK85_13485 [Verrucomicrobiales bacterium]|nr:hypothetical protein [Verrucomicrobiales bacterium]
MNAKSASQLGFAVVALAAAAWIVWRSMDHRSINLNPYQSLGGVAAEEVSRLLGNQGQVVVVLNDPGPDPDPVMDAQVAAFRGALAKVGKVAIKATELIPMDGFVRMRTGGAMPVEHFDRLKQTHGDADAVVLFLGCPMLAGDTAQQVKSWKARLVVISAALPWYDDLVRQGLVRLAIVPRTAAEADADSGAAPVGSTAGGPRAEFDREYRILRADDSTSPAPGDKTAR